jgi:hypothetical protein
MTQERKIDENVDPYNLAEKGKSPGNLRGIKIKQFP